MAYDISIDKEIDSFGTTVQVYSKGTVYYDDWGKPSYDTTEKEIVVIVNDITGEEEWNREGRFVPGDKKIFLKSTDDVNQDEIVKIGDEWYKITGKPVRHVFKGNTQQKEVMCKRIDSNASSIPHVI